MTCDTRVRYECQITSSLWHQWLLKTCQNQLPYLQQKCNINIIGSVWENFCDIELFVLCVDFCTTLKQFLSVTAFNSSPNLEASFLHFFSLSLLCPLLLLLPFLLSPTPSHSASVKYIKEMSAFFKSSGSPGAGLPWDSPPSTPQRGTELSPAEVKEPRSIPLKMCQVSRKQCPPDTENRYYMLKLQRFM